MFVSLGMACDSLRVQQSPYLLLTIFVAISGRLALVAATGFPRSHEVSRDVGMNGEGMNESNDI